MNIHIEQIENGFVVSGEFLTKHSTTRFFFPTKEEVEIAVKKLFEKNSPSK